MPTLVGVSLRAAGRIHYYEMGDLELAVGERVVVETARGLELGQVVSFREGAGEAEGAGRIGRVLRLAREDDLQQFSRGRLRALEALEVARERIKHHNLPMKMLDVETTLDGSKLVLYFDSESRVDFRGLVRDLAATLHKRIELHQVGSRDRSALTGGLGPCGRACCCSSWARELYPVSIKMAKEQNLSLNPTKISGSCGRLMCCLRYEYQTYRELRRGMPRIGETLDLPEGQVRVVAVNLGRCSLKVEHPEEGTYEVPPERVKALGLGLPLPAPADSETEKGLPPVARRSTDQGPGALSPEAEKLAESSSESPPSRLRTGGRASRHPQERSHPPARSRREAPPLPDRSRQGPEPAEPVSGDKPAPPASRKRPRKGRKPQPEASPVAGERSKQSEKKRPRRGSGRTRPAGQAFSAEASASEKPPSPDTRESGRGRRRGRDRRPGGRHPDRPASEKPPESA